MNEGRSTFSRTNVKECAEFDLSKKAAAEKAEEKERQRLQWNKVFKVIDREIDQCYPVYYKVFVEKDDKRSTATTGLRGDAGRSETTTKGAA